LNFVIRHYQGRTSAMKKILPRALFGLTLGLGFAVLQVAGWEVVDRAFRDHPAASRWIELTVELLNGLAAWISYFWVNVLRLGPRGEIAWVVVPVVSVLLQWGLIGLIVGLWWGIRSTSPADERHSHVRAVALAIVGGVIGLGLLGRLVGTPFSGQTPRNETPADIAENQQINLEEARRAVEINPGDPAKQYRLGVAFAGRGQIDEAVTHFRTALRIKPDDPHAHYRLGLALAEKGQTEDAIVCYRQALALQPNYPAAQEHLDQAMKAKP
jgi:tetratricopeptide (TPR) repeat protein